MGLFLAAPVTSLRTLVANSAKWQELVNTHHGGGVSVANAQTKVFRGGAPGSQAAPLVCVGPTGGRRVFLDSSTTFNVEGPLAMSFELPVAEANESDPDAAFIAAMTDIETIIEQMADKSLEGGFLAVRAFVETHPPIPGDPQQNKGVHWYWSQWDVELLGSG